MFWGCGRSDLKRGVRARFSALTERMIENIGYKTYIVFMVFCIIGFLYAAFVLPELKGLTLEEVDAVFNDTSGTEDKARRERIAKQIGLDKIAQDVQHKEGAAEKTPAAANGEGPYRSEV